MPIKNHPPNDGVSSPELDSHHCNIVSGAFGAGRDQNAGPDVVGFLFKTALWITSEFLAGCAAYAEAVYPMHARQDERHDSSDAAGSQQSAEVIQIKRASESRNAPDIKGRRGRSKLS
jgi:hypothetical protein